MKAEDIHSSLESFDTFAAVKLIAYDITNLTDARYFAARGARMIGFSASYSTIEEVNAIKEWVDVPSFFIRLPDEASADLIWEWQERTGISTFLSSGLSEDITALFPDTSWLHYFEKESECPESNLVFVSIEQIEDWVVKQGEFSSSYSECDGYALFETSMTKDLIEQLDGLAIKGSDEDKVGLKSFDAIDGFLDQLDIEY